MSKAQFLADTLTPKLRRSLLRRNAFGVVPYTLAAVGGLISPYVTLSICGVVAVFYALPSTTADAAPTP